MRRPLRAAGGDEGFQVGSCHCVAVPVLALVSLITRLGPRDTEDPLVSKVQQVLCYLECRRPGVGRGRVTRQPLWFRCADHRSVRGPAVKEASTPGTGEDRMILSTPTDKEVM